MIKSLPILLKDHRYLALCLHGMLREQTKPTIASMHRHAYIASQFTFNLSTGFVYEHQQDSVFLHSRAWWLGPFQVSDQCIWLRPGLRISCWQGCFPSRKHPCRLQEGKVTSSVVYIWRWTECFQTGTKQGSVNSDTPCPAGRSHTGSQHYPISCWLAESMDLETRFRCESTCHAFVGLAYDWDSFMALCSANTK